MIIRSYNQLGPPLLEIELNSQMERIKKKKQDWSPVDVFCSMFSKRCRLLQSTFVLGGIERSDVRIISFDNWSIRLLHILSFFFSILFFNKRNKTDMFNFHFHQTNHAASLFTNNLRKKGRWLPWNIILWVVWLKLEKLKKNLKKYFFY